MLTQTQHLWLQCHYLLDDGVQPCPQCNGVSPGRYCPDCGEALVPDLIACTTCGMLGSARF
jgi:hypothetical protein